MTKIAQPGVAAQMGGKKLSLEMRIDAVVTLAWMADGMHLPPGAIAKAANASIVLETAIQKFWSRIKAGETPSSIVITKKTGNKTQRHILMRPWYYKSKVLTLIYLWYFRKHQSLNWDYSEPCEEGAVEKTML